MSPSVSIGVPVFNAAPFLSETLDSVLAQTHGDFELIISDNASTDGTQDVIQAYAARDKRIRSFRQPVNIGLGNNWSFVARQARCTWFKWLSANDYCAPRLLEDSLAPLRADPAVVLCYGRTQLIDLAGQPLEVYAGDFDATSDDPLQRYRLVRERLHLGTPLQAGVVRLDALRRCGYLPNYRDCDRVLIAGLALIGKFVTLPQTLFYRRWDASVASALRGPAGNGAPVSRRRPARADLHEPAEAARHARHRVARTRRRTRERARPCCHVPLHGLETKNTRGRAPR
jgi:glycosyltransferase involved in cell wall biosynthesis